MHNRLFKKIDGWQTKNDNISRTHDIIVTKLHNVRDNIECVWLSYLTHALKAMLIDTHVFFCTINLYTSWSAIFVAFMKGLLYNIFHIKCFERASQNSMLCIGVCHLSTFIQLTQYSSGIFQVMSFPSVPLIILVLFIV
jgi:hypothetical protein